jgi:hypothetical protein
MALSDGSSHRYDVTLKNIFGLLHLIGVAEN